MRKYDNSFKKMAQWRVVSSNKRVDYVFFDDDCDEHYVRAAMEADGYMNASVKKVWKQTKFRGRILL